jgi:two-component system sensor histidine kinase CreC
VVREAAEALRPLWAVRRLEVHVAAPDGPQARGERFLLVQAVTNLLQNALEFTPEGGMIEMRLETAVGEARIVIEDTGPGVPDYAVERIFERFYSLARPDTGRKSTGLGLSFVREIAVLHGGEAGVANRPEGGARATLRLPLL